MNHPNESDLTQLLLEQAERFRSALETLGQIEAVLRSQGWNSDTYEHLQTALQSVTLDPRCKHLFVEHRQARLKSSRLSRAVSECKEILTALAEKVEVIERIAVELKGELAPQIDQGVRARAAVDAYRSAANGSGGTCHEQV